MRSFTFFLILSSVVFAKETIEIFAKNVIAKDNSVSANNSVVILYEGSMIKADSAFYDRNSSLLTLRGKVEMIGFDDRVLASEKLIINTKDKSVNIAKVFLSGDEDLWIDASSANKKETHYKLFNSRISSCNKLNPDWTIEFDEADYYEDRNFVTMEGAKLRFYDTTVFYLPYLALPTLNERTTGLLFPNFKLSDREGFLYEQPIFYAPSNSWDMELNPQVRSKRGVGSYLTTRFVDSNHSEGFVRVGYFLNDKDYVRRNNTNKEHWGTELSYKSIDFLPMGGGGKEYNSAFYFNGTYLNDREYLNLQKDSVSALVTSNLIESRLNMFLYNEENYFGLYGRYNIDTSQENNYRTIQDIPSLHYHHYMKHIADSKFFYTIDARLHNYTRVEGSRASQLQMDVPLTYYDSFFDDFVDLSISENLYLSRVDFRNLSLDEDKGNYYYYRNYHKIKLSSDLVKRYGGSIHNLSPSLTYIQPSIERESHPYRELIDEKKELFATQTQEEQLSLALSQYYYSQKLDMSLFHRFGYTSYPQRVESRGDFNNEMGYNGEDIRLYSNLTYAWNEKQIRSLISSIGYNQNNYDIMLTHFYNNDFLYDNKKTSFLQSELMHSYSDKNSWFVNFDYDLEQLYNHQWKLGWSHKQKCWSARVSVGQEVVPNVDNSFRNTALYLELNLNPIGGIEQNIEESFSSEGNK